MDRLRGSPRLEPLLPLTQTTSRNRRALLRPNNSSTTCGCNTITTFLGANVLRGGMTVCRPKACVSDPAAQGSGPGQDCERDRPGGSHHGCCWPLAGPHTLVQHWVHMRLRSWRHCFARGRGQLPGDGSRTASRSPIGLAASPLLAGESHQCGQSLWFGSLSRRIQGCEVAAESKDMITCRTFLDRAIRW